MSYKSVKLECPRRSVKRDCLTRVSSKKSLKFWSGLSVSRKSVKSECLTRVSLHSVKQRVSNFGQDLVCPARVSSQSVLQECHCTVSSKSVLQERQHRCCPELPSETVSMKFDGMYFLGCLSCVFNQVGMSFTCASPGFPIETKSERVWSGPESVSS